MLTDPPCIRLLVGCSGSDDTSVDVSGNASSSSSSYSYASSSPASYTSPSLLGDLNARLPAFASGTLIGKSAKEYVARYVISAKNVSKNALQGVKIAHGPLPFGAEFDPSQSSNECHLNTKFVECVLNLASGESKDLSLSYKAGGSMSCAVARLLQRAKTTLSGVTGSSQTSPVITTVTCRMESRDSGSPQGLYAVPSSASTIVGHSGSKLALTSDSGFKNSGYKQGYKPYTDVIPRTGAMEDLFTQVTHADFVILKGKNQHEEYSLTPLIFLGILSMTIIIVLLMHSFRRTDAM